jgi:hypothetical protein
MISIQPTIYQLEGLALRSSFILSRLSKKKKTITKMKNNSKYAKYVKNAKSS